MISNVKEFEIERPGDLVMERRSLSGKKQINNVVCHGSQWSLYFCSCQALGELERGVY